MILLVAFLLQADLSTKALDSIESEKIFAHIEELSSDAYQGREAGSAGSDKAADYLEGKLKEWKLVPAGTRNLYFQSFPAEGKTMRNVLAVVPGSHATLK